MRDEEVHGGGRWAAGAHMDRRSLLALAAAGALRLGGAGALVRRDGKGDLDEVARWLSVTPRERVLARAARALRGRLSTVDLLGACFLAAVRGVDPTVPVFNHAALVVSSLARLAAGRPAHEAASLALWGVDAFSAAQEREELEHRDWSLPAAPAPPPCSPERARAALILALERWDREAADVALVAFLRAAPLPDVQELLAEYATRCQANIGHKAIFCAMAARTLPLVGAEHAEDVLRALVASYFLHGRTELAKPFETSRALVDEGLALPAAAEGEPGAAADLHARLATAGPEDSARSVAERLRSGVPAAPLWEGITASATDIVRAAPGIGPLHALTSLNSLHHLFRTARTERVRQLALLQAAAWTALFRAAAAGAGAPPPGGAALAGTDVEDLLARVRHGAEEVHEVKFPVAVAEEIALGGRYSRPFLRAALPVHVPPAGRPEGETQRRVREALESAG